MHVFCYPYSDVIMNSSIMLCYLLDYDDKQLLQEGEELTITYGTVWFEDRNMQSRREDGKDPMHHHMDDPDSFLGAVTL